MSQNPRGITPLNWQSFVEETIRRRKNEGLTQREHAALAKVSIPTMADFEKGEKTLSLAKAFDILKVVGLFSELEKNDSQAAFVHEAFTRWRHLISDSPKDSPGRFPYGHVRFDYFLEGDLRIIDLKDFRKILLESTDLPRSVWSPFPVTEETSNLNLIEIQGVLEHWVFSQKKIGDPIFPAYCDFWRADPRGRMFLIRDYEEDSVETFPASSIFDTMLPIWRMGATLLHAERLSSLLKKNPNTEIMIHFRAVYSGLNGRVLCSWSDPLSNVFLEERAAKSDEAVLESIISANGLSSRLVEYLYPLASSLYERFGVTELSKNLVQAGVDRLLKNYSK
jgi:hypothetical protein